MADEGGRRTAGSQRALGLAELVNKIFENERVPSSLAAHAGYRIEMAGPGSLTTTSPTGAQHQLKLVPADAAESKPDDGGAATLVIGTADANLTQLELRTYEELSQRHGARFKGDPLPVERAAFDALVAKIQKSLAPQGIETVSSASRHELTVRPGGGEGEGEGEEGPKKPLVPIAVAAIVLILLAVAFFALKK
jgi:hypothetical protein